MANTIEGYLYSFGPSRQGGVYCILTFCVLSRRHFAQSRNKGDLVSLRSGILDVDHRIEDTGRQVVNGKILYTLRLYNVASAKKEVLLGAVSSEEIAEWLKAFTSSLGRPLESVPAEPWTPSAGVRLPFAHFGEQFVGDASPTGSPRLQLESPMFQGQREKSFTSLTTIGHVSPKLERNATSLGSSAPDSAQASKWKLVRCENGLRFFQEATDFPFVYKLPVMKAVGVVKAPADQIFNLIMDYGPERQQWDHTLESASVIEVIDGHSDVLYICLRQDWGFLRPRDLCLARYWKREETGAYSVFYRSVLKQPLQAGYVRAYIHSGGYIVTPLKTNGNGKPRTLVESVLEMDAAGWSSLLGAGFSGYPTHLRDSLLGVVAGIREHVAAQRFNSRVTIIKRHLIEEYTDSLQVANHDLSENAANNAPFLSTSDDIEEFFDATMDQFSDSSESVQSVSEPILPSVEHHKPLRIKVRSDRGTFDLSKFRGSVGRGPLKGGKHSFAEPDSSAFLLKGINSLSTGSREPAGKSFCKLVGMDWYKSNDIIDHIAGRPRSLVQRACSNEGLFFFVINLQIPYTQNYSLVFYFATEEDITEGSLLHRFISGDDTFRNSRLSLIPAIPEGSWIVRQAVGTKAVPLGQIVETKYHVGFNYMEMDINLGSSGVVRGVLGLVFGYISALVVDMAFFISGETADELPERLIGVGRCSHIQLDKAIDLPAS